MAEKTAKSADKGGARGRQHICPNCHSETRVTLFVGYGRRGLYWVCEKNCGYVARRR